MATLPYEPKRPGRPRRRSATAMMLGYLLILGGGALALGGVGGVGMAMAYWGEGGRRAFGELFVGGCALACGGALVAGGVLLFGRWF